MSVLPQEAFQVIQLIPYPDIFLEFSYTVAISRLFTKYCIVYQTCSNILFYGKEKQFRKQNQAGWYYIFEFLESAPPLLIDLLSF